MTTHAAHFSLLALLLTVAPLGALADDREGPAPLVWNCVQEYDASFHVLCMPRLAGKAATGLHADGSGEDSSDDAAPTPRWTNMTPVAQRGDAEVMSTQAWRVPLHVAPRDMTKVGALLESALCGKRDHCSVRYAGRPTQVAAR